MWRQESDQCKAYYEELAQHHQIVYQCDYELVCAETNKITALRDKILGQSQMPSC